MEQKIDFDWLLRLRTVVARCGEMDACRWWNTTGQLSAYGAKVLRRGFPRTHYFAQARSVFAVAAHRCAEVYDPPRCATLWNLTDDIEDRFDARWEGWVDSAEQWAPFFESIAETKDFNVVDLLRRFKLVNDGDVEEAEKLKKSPKGDGIQVHGPFVIGHRDVALLALAFGKSGKGELLVPYAPLEAV